MPVAYAEVIKAECKVQRKRHRDVVRQAGLPPNFVESAEVSLYHPTIMQLWLVGGALHLPLRDLYERAEALVNAWTGAADLHNRPRLDLDRLVESIKVPCHQRVLVTSATVPCISLVELGMLVDEPHRKVKASVEGLRAAGAMHAYPAPPGDMKYTLDDRIRVVLLRAIRRGVIRLTRSGAPIPVGFVRELGDGAGAT